MSNERNANIRHLILVLLQQQRQRGNSESGGWVQDLTLRKLLDHSGYPLTREELGEFMAYLTDPQVQCCDEQRVHPAPPPRYKYRLTARGVRHLEGIEIVPGVGLGWRDE